MRIFSLFILCLAVTSSLFSQQFGYVANSIGDSISILDVENNKTVGYVNNNSFNIAHPVQVMFNPSRKKAYVVSDVVHSVFIIDPGTNTITGKVDDSLFPFSAPSSIDITPDGLKAYVTNESSNNVSIIDLTTNTVIGNVNVGGFPFNLPVSVTIDRLGVKAYVTNFNGNTVSVIDIATNTVIKYVTTTISTPFSQPFHIGFIGTTKVYITNINGPPAQGVSIVDYATDTVTGYVNPGAFPFFNPKNLLIGTIQPLAYIENGFNSLVSIVNLATDTVLGYYPYLTFNSPDSAHLTFDGRFLYVVNKGSNLINIIDSVTTLPVTSVDSSAFPLNGPSSIDMSPFIVSPPAPSPVPLPTNFQGVKKKNRFATQADLVNIITWDPPSSSNIVVSYKIYRDVALMDLAATVPMCAPLEFEDHNRRKGQTYNYFIVAIYADGSISGAATVSLTW